MPKKPNYDNAPPLLRDFIVYLQLVKNRSELTVLNYYTDLRTFLRYYKIKLGRASDDPDEFTKIDISDITEAELKAVDLMLVQEFLIFTKTEKANDHKARYRKAVALRQFFKFLTNNKGLFDVNPMTNLELPSPKPALPKYLTLEQSLEMLTHIDTPDQKRDYCIVVFFLNCGMRLSELVGINISDIRFTHDIDGNVIYSLKVLGKGSKERIVYLNNACVNAYMDYIDPSETDEEKRRQKGLRCMTAKTDALFLSRRGTRISNRRVQQIVEDCFKSCGLDNMGLSVHKLRHTAATLMYQNGVDVRVLKDVLGHENLNTTQIYTHVSNAQMQDAMRNNPLSNVTNNKKE
ncbi:MAG: tyrosine-type recombinase/integrase [Oscillospiraceae bacterium]|nr:tyrosine-type recombinase/integrase [Oscillospiraceae bacterium]